MTSIPSTTAQYVTIVHNTTVPLIVTIPWQNLANSSGLSTYTSITFIAKWSYLDSDGSAAISKSLSNGIVITTAGANNGSSGTNAVITITIAASDTASLPISITNLELVFQCMGKDSSGFDWPICRGQLTIEPNASQAI